MSTSKQHGFSGYVEAPRPDDDVGGIPANEHAEARAERTPTGQWTKGAKTAQTKGGKARKGSTKLSHVGGTKEARSLRRALGREIASSVGGGTCDVAASLFLRWAADKAEMAEKAKAEGDAESFRKLTESARMDVVYAREHAAKTAQSRPQKPAWMARLGVGEGGKP